MNEFKVKNGIVIDNTTPINNISKDYTLSGNSDSTLVTESAIRTYVTNIVSSAGGGDMLKSQYASASNNIVDTSYNSLALDGHATTYYATSANLNTHIIDYTNPHQVTKTQVGLSAVDNTSDLNKPISTATQTALDLKFDTSGIGQYATTASLLGSDTVFDGQGVVSGINISIGSPTSTFSISSGTYHKMGVSIPVSFAGVTNQTITNIVTQQETYLAIDTTNNTIVQSSGPFTPSQRRSYIVLGILIHTNNSTINAVNNLPDVAIYTLSQLNDFIDNIKGFNIRGNIISPNGANLSINKSFGELFKRGINFENDPTDPHTKDMSALSAPNTLRIRMSNGVEGANTSVLDLRYESSVGVLSSIPSNKFVVFRVVLFPSNLIRLQYGQNVYSTIADAVTGINSDTYTVEQNMADNGLLRGYIIVRSGTTELNNPLDAKFVEADKFGSNPVGGSGGGVTTLQGVYDNSIQPEIVTNSTLGALSVKRGSTADTDNVFEIMNGSGTITAYVKGNGIINHTDGVANGDSATVGQMNTAIATAITTGMDYKGDYDASTDTPSLDDGTPIAGIKIGDTYTVTVAGNFFTIAVEAGDTLIAKQDSPTIAAHWTIVQANMTPQSILSALLTVDGTGSLLDADLLDGNHASAFALSSHAHGNITNDGKVGVTSGIPLITGTAGLIQAGSFSTTAGTFAEGNDSRFLSTTDKTDLTDGGASTLHYHASDRDRANHTGTQLASTISDFSSAAQSAAVAQTITNGVTTSAPSQDAVYDAIQLLKSAGLANTIQVAGATTGTFADSGVTLDSFSSGNIKRFTKTVVSDSAIVELNTTDAAKPKVSLISVNDGGGEKYLTNDGVNISTNLTIVHSQATLSTESATLGQVDAKVADSISDGVTTIAPSQNAVYDALALKRNYLASTSGEDLNLIAGEGIGYKNSPVNKPTGAVNGWLEQIGTIASGERLQIYRETATVTEPRTWDRKHNGTSWSTWKEVNPYSFLYASVTDLNTFLRGIVYVSAAGVTNEPSGASNGWVRATNTGYEGTTVILQEYIEYANLNSWRRSSADSGVNWSAWSKVANDADKLDKTTGTAQSVASAVSFAGAIDTIQADIIAAAGTQSSFNFRNTSAGSGIRWQIRKNADVESTGNLGSNFEIRSWSDTGTLIDTPITINRVAGGTIALVRPLTNTAQIKSTKAGSGVDGSALNITSSDPTIYINDTNAALDEKIWEARVAGGDYIFRGLNDAETVPSNAFIIGRTGGTVDNFHIPITTESTSNTTGALTIAGGVGVVGKLTANESYFGATGQTAIVIKGGNEIDLVGTDVDNQAIYFNWTGFANGTTRFRDVVISNGKSVQIARFIGAAIGSAKLEINATTASTSTTTGALTVTGGVGVSGAIYAGNSSLDISANFGRDTNAGDSTNYTTVNIGNFGSGQGKLALQYTNAVASSSPRATISFQPRKDDGTTAVNPANIIFEKTAGANTATLTVFSAGKGLSVGPTGDCTITGTTASTTTATGSLIVSGGVGVTGAINVGSTINSATLTASTALVTDANKNLVSSAVTATQLGYVSGVTSAIQTQLDNRRLIVANTTSEDLNTITTDSIGYKNSPVNGPSGAANGTLEQFTVSTAKYQTYREYQGGTNPRSWSRRYNGTSWTSWIQLGVQSKSVTIPTPANTDTIMMWITDTAITLTKVVGKTTEGTLTATVNGNALNVTSTIGSMTPTTSAAIAANTLVTCAISSMSGVTGYVNVTVYYTVD